MPIESYTRSVNDVYQHVTRQFGDEAGIQVSVSDVVRWINTGQREIVSTNTTINEAIAKTNIVAGQSEYPILRDAAFSNLQNVHTVMHNGVPLAGLSFEEALESIINGQETVNQGTPTIWYIKAGILNLWPTPKTAITNGLKIIFTKAPVAVTGTGDTLGIPDNYYNALIEYVMKEAYEMDENFQAAGVKAQQFEKSVNRQSNQTVVQQSEFHVIQADMEDYY
jgi:hypothetical protein